MATKFLALLAFITVAGAVEYQQQYDLAPAKNSEYKHVEPEAPAHYDFSYGVHDEHTGDVKEQKESREGDVVHGSYSLIDADGYKRIVEYTVDKHSGFNAVVRREPLGHQESYKPKVQVSKVVPIVHYAKAPAPQYYEQASGHYQAAPAVDHEADVHVSYNAPDNKYNY